MKTRIAPLDGLRGLAVLMVFLFHYRFGAHSSFFPFRVAAWMMGRGSLGVTIFFALSGFLITGILWDTREQSGYLKTFYMRRVCRIFPLYYLALVVTIIAAFWAGTQALALPRIWPTALFLQDFPGYPTFCINAPAAPVSLFHFWSLAVEEHFYLIWPFVLGFCKDLKAAMKVCLVMFLVFEGIAILCSVWGTLYQFLPLFLNRSGEMAAGAWLALKYREGYWNRTKRPAQIMLPLSIVLYVAMEFFQVREIGIFWQPIRMLLGGSLLVVTLHDTHISRLMTAFWLRWLGGISYGVYVYHVLLGKAFPQAARAILHGHSGTSYEVAMRLIAAICTLAVAWISFKFFESPMIQIGHRYKPSAAESGRRELHDASKASECRDADLPAATPRRREINTAIVD
jgi:peptidoglycan/LPS O-acetylase OafA/YrhL